MSILKFGKPRCVYMKLKFNVTGMTCAACSARVEKVTGQVTGVKQAEVNLLAGTMVVEAENEAVIAEIVSAIEKAGYGASIAGEKVKKKPMADPTAVRMAAKGLKNIARINGVCDAKVAVNGGMTTLTGITIGMIIASAVNKAVKVSSFVLFLMIGPSVS